MKNNIRRIVAAVMLILSTAVLSQPAVKVKADNTARHDDTPVDIVLLLDCSGTMEQSDPQHWTSTATKDFVQTLTNENVRLMVIAFGNDYGKDAYSVGMQDADSRNRVKIAYPLTSLSDEKEREKARNAIDEEMSEHNPPTYTPIGYALEAAVDELEDKGSSDGSAAIVLMSDGRVEGETDYTNKGSDLDYKSIDSSCDKAKSHSWPVYCMELNYDGENKAGSGVGGIGYHQMRENIPGRTGTEPFEVKSAGEAETKLNDILDAIYPGNERQHGETQPGEDVKIPVGEMTAEQTVTVTGDISKVESLALTSPDGTQETYAQSDGDQSMANRRVVFDQQSAVVTMILPEEGTWVLKLNGDTQTTVNWTSVSFKEMNLDLSADNEGGDEKITRGTKVKFEAKFSYNGQAYQSEKFYSGNPAKLYVTGHDPVTMETSENGYSAEVTFDDTGSFDVYAQVDSSYFRGGNKKSGTFTYNVEKAPVKTEGVIEELKAEVGGSAEVSLGDYFEGDDLTYSLEENDLDDFSGEIKDGILTLTAGNTGDKTYHCTVKAQDSSGGHAEQSIRFFVTNQKVELTKGDEINVSLIADPDDAPGWAKADRDSDTFVLKDSDYFSDPDGAQPDVRIWYSEDSSGRDIAEVAHDNDATTVKALKTGNATVYVVAIDGNAENEGVPLTLNIRVQSAAQAAVGRRIGIIIPVLIILAVVIVLLIINFAGRKIYGVWDITLDGMLQESVDMSKVHSGKHGTASVSRILIELGFGESDFSDAQIKAGSPFTKKVSFCRLGNVDRIYLNDSAEITGDNKKKDIEVGINQIIELDNNGQRVVFDRRK